MPKKMKLLKTPLKDWNKNNFGHIDKKISNFEEEIFKLQKLGDERKLNNHELARLTF